MARAGLAGTKAKRKKQIRVEKETVPDSGLFLNPRRDAIIKVTRTLRLLADPDLHIYWDGYMRRCEGTMSSATSLMARPVDRLGKDKTPRMKSRRFELVVPFTIACGRC